MCSSARSSFALITSRTPCIGPKSREYGKTRTPEAAAGRDRDAQDPAANAATARSGEGEGETGQGAPQGEETLEGGPVWKRHNYHRRSMKAGARAGGDVRAD